MTGPDSEGLQAEAVHIFERANFKLGKECTTLCGIRYAPTGLHPAPTCEACETALGKIMAAGVPGPVLTWVADSGGSSPVVPSAGAVPVEVEGSALARMLERYLATRGHTLSTAHLTGMEQMLAEAEYVLGEAQELRDAVVVMAEAHQRGEATSEHLRKVRHEVADVALADTTFASLMPGGVTVELCIAEKTEADRGRG